MMSVTFSYCYAECHYAECHYAESRKSEYHYAESCNAECHYAECRGAIFKFSYRNSLGKNVARSLPIIGR
jgi:hypothetical protein